MSIINDALRKVQHTREKRDKKASLFSKKENQEEKTPEEKPAEPPIVHKASLKSEASPIINKEPTLSPEPEPPIQAPPPSLFETAAEPPKPPATEPVAQPVREPAPEPVYRPADTTAYQEPFLRKTPPTLSLDIGVFLKTWGHKLLIAGCFIVCVFLVSLIINVVHTHTAPPSKEDFHLKGIVMMPERNVVLINDRAYEVGDMVNGMRIMDIEIDQVTFSRWGRKTILKVKR